MFHHRQVAYALLRLTVGAVFLFYGLGKFVDGVTATAQGLAAAFAKTWVPAAVVYDFSLALPFIEVTVGVLLAAGLFTYGAAIAGALLITALTIGQTIRGESTGVALNLVYALTLFVLIWAKDENTLALDGLRKQ